MGTVRKRLAATRACQAHLPCTERSGVVLPEVLLIDATWACQRNHQKAFARIPDFLTYARDQGLGKAGAAIVTDDPKTYFVLNKRLMDSGFRVESKAYPAEASETNQVLLSPNRYPQVPVGRSPSQHSTKSTETHIRLSPTTGVRCSRVGANKLALR